MKKYHYHFEMAQLIGNNNFQDVMYHFNSGLHLKIIAVDCT